MPADDENPREPLARSEFLVTMSDTDSAQVIFAGAPFRWTERITTTWLATVANQPLSRMLSSGFGLPAAHIEVVYRSPLRLDDPVVATLWLERRSRRSLTFRCDFATDLTLDPAVTVTTTQVYAQISGDGQISAVPIPERLSLALGEPTTN